MNKVQLTGRIASEIDMRSTASGVSVCGFRVAVNRRFKNADGQYEADFISCVAWRSTAEFISRYFKKGSSICVVGSIQVRSWDQNGQKRYATEVVADEVSFVAPASQTAPGAPAGGSSYTPDAYASPSFGSAQGASFEEIPNDESLPF